MVLGKLRLIGILANEGIAGYMMIGRCGFHEGSALFRNPVMAESIPCLGCAGLGENVDIMDPFAVAPQARFGLAQLKRVASPMRTYHGPVIKVTISPVNEAGTHRPRRLRDEQRRPECQFFLAFQIGFRVSDKPERHGEAGVRLTYGDAKAIG